MGSSRMNVRDFSEWDESDVHVRPNKKGSRPRTKDRPTFKEAIRGRVITVDRGRWSVVVDEGTENERTLIAARAKELRRTPIVTGDFVDVVGDTSGAKDTLARIVRLGERTSVLRRSADDTDPSERVVVANAQQLVIVVAAANPEPRTGFIDRAVVAAVDAGIEPMCVTPSICWTITPPAASRLFSRPHRTAWPPARTVPRVSSRLPCRSCCRSCWVRYRSCWATRAWVSPRW